MYERNFSTETRTLSRFSAGALPVPASRMVYIRKSVSNMARAAATSARVAAEAKRLDKRDAVDAIATAAVVAVFKVSPHKAPAAAARAAKKEAGGSSFDGVANASSAIATAVAAGVAAASVGWNFEKVEDIAKRAADAFNRAYVDKTGIPITVEEAGDVAKDVAIEVKKHGSRYPAVEAAAAAADACLTGRSDVDATAATAAAAAAAAAAAFRCSDEGGLPYNTASYAAIAAARATTNRVAPVPATASAAASAACKPASAAVSAAYIALHVYNTAQNEKMLDPEDIDAAVAAAAVAASADPDSAPPVPVPTGTFGTTECFERVPASHEFTKGKLQTILEVDTFLAGFLLFSLTGRKESDTVMVSDAEKLQVIMQTLTFGVFLAATVLTGMCTVGTGSRYALTSGDLLAPFLLSSIGFILLLISVASAIHIELGGGFYSDDENHSWYWLAVGVGLGC